MKDHICYKMKAKHSLGILFTLIVTCSTAFIGDILIREKEKDDSNPDVSQGVRLADPSRLWPGGKVYYK